MYKLWLFDWDNTLVDSHDAVVAAVGDILAQSGLGAVDAAAEFSGRSHMAFDTMMHDIFNAQSQPQPGRDFSRDWIAGAAQYMAAAHPIEGAQAFIDAIKVHQPEAHVAIVSNGYKDTIAKALPLMGLERYFSEAGIYAQDQGYAQKPDPAMLMRAMTDFKVKASEIVMIGDTAADAAAARAAGVEAWILSRGAFDYEKILSLKEAGANIIFDSFEDLRSRIFRPEDSPAPKVM